MPKNRKRTSVSDNNLESKFGKIILDMEDTKSEKLVVVDDTPVSSQPNVVSTTTDTTTSNNLIDSDPNSTITYSNPIINSEKSNILSLPTQVFVTTATSPRAIAAISSKENTPKGDHSDKEFIYPTHKLYPISTSSALLSSLASSPTPTHNSVLPQAQTILSTLPQFQTTPADIHSTTFTTFDSSSYPQVRHSVLFFFVIFYLLF